MRETTRAVLRSSCAIAFVLGCTRASPPAVTEDPTRPLPVPTSVSTAIPVPPALSSSPATSANARLPTVDTSCETDGDCVVFDEASTGGYACCLFGGGCVLNIGNKVSVAAFRAACKAQPPNACPPVGCAQPASPKAKCDAHKCVVVR